MHAPESTNAALRAMPAQVKILALLGFLIAVVATHPRTLWPYLAHFLIVGAVIAIARVRPARLARGLVIEVPFLLFALALPFIATGESVRVFGLPLSLAGLLGAGSLIAKATLGVLGAVVLAETTTPAQLLAGLRRLRLPAQLVEIMGFMIRYAGVIAEQWQRMRIARQARGFVPAGPGSWATLGRSVGTLFVRSYERGERVHLAMLSRGYPGHLPDALDPPQPARLRDWLAAAVPVALAWSVVLATRWP